MPPTIRTRSQSQRRPTLKRAASASELAPPRGGGARGFAPGTEPPYQASQNFFATRSQLQKRRVASKHAPAARGRDRSRTLLAQNPPPPPFVHERPCWQLFGWGDNEDGQIGSGDSLSPPSGKPRRSQYVEKLIAEGEFGPIGSGLKSIAAGGFFSLLLDESGQVWSVGSNEAGQLGRATAKDKDEVPARIQCLTEEGFRAVHIVAGSCIAAALSDRGELRVWGAYYFSNNGDGRKFSFSPTVEKQLAPVPLPALAGERFSSVATGTDHVVLLTVEGDFYTLGRGNDGQLGHHVPKGNPSQGTILHRVLRHSSGHWAVAIGAGSDTSFFVDHTGTVWGWGLNGDRQIGTRSKSSIVWYPQRISRLSEKTLNGAAVVQIAGGQRHTLFLTSDGRVFACGDPQDGALGLADDDPALCDGEGARRSCVSEPVQVTFPHDVGADPIVQVAGSSRISAAVTRDGVLYCWGLNNAGQIGIQKADGGSDVVKTPAVVVRRDGAWWAKVVACGGMHTLALLRKKP